MESMTRLSSLHSSAPPPTNEKDQENSIVEEEEKTLKDSKEQKTAEVYSTSLMEMAASAGFDEERLLAWRDQTRALPQRQGAKRFFANPDSSGGIWVDTLTGPCIISWMEGNVNDTSLSPGLYHVVFCISVGSEHVSLVSKGLVVVFIVGTYEVVFTSTEEQVELLGMDLIKDYNDIELLKANNAIVRIRYPFQASIRFHHTELRIGFKAHELPEQTLLFHYFELQDVSLDPDPADILIGLPKTPVPINVLDVNQNEPAKGTSAPSKPTAILSYAISPSSIYAATLSRTVDQGQIHLWELRSTDTSDFSDAKLAAHGVFNWKIGSVWISRYSLSVSNGGQVVVLLRQHHHHLSIGITVFNFDTFFTPAGNKARSSTLGAMPTLAYTPVLQPNTHAASLLKGLSGYGKFVQGAKDDEEYYIFCDGLAVFLYSTAGDWKLLYKRVLTENAEPDTDNAIILVNGAGGGRYAWTGNLGVISVWRLDSDRLLAMVSVAGKVLGISFSEDGQKMLVSTEEEGFVYSVNTGTLLKKGRLLEEASFVLGDSQLMCHGGGYIVSSASLLEMCSFYRTRPIDRQEYTVMPGTSGALVATSHDSRLMISALADILEEPCVLACRQGCLNVRKAVNREKDNFVVSDDLEFRVGTNDDITKFVISAHQSNEEPRVIHTLLHGWVTRVSFLDSSPFLVAEYGSHLFIWRLPANTIDPMELVLFWHSERPLQPELDSESLSGREPSLEDDSDPFLSLQLKIACEHDQSIHLSPLPKSVVLSLCNPLTSDTAEYIFGSFPELVQWYQRRDNDTNSKRAILQYIGRHFGAYPDPTRPSLSFMSALCEAWDISNHLVLETILLHLFHDGHVKWVPPDTYTKESSPLTVLLEKARTQPKVLGLITTIIEYCVEKAQEERDFVYVSPVLSSLDDLIDVFPDVAAKFLQSLVYIPVKSRSIVINHHAIAYPPTLRRFWIPNQQPLHLIPNPILQLRFSPKKTDPVKDYFTQELFIASFDLLWPRHNHRNAFKSSSSSSEESEDSWAGTLLALVLVSLGIRTSHSAPFRGLEMLHFDSPAVEALIQYKWNNIAFAAWLIRMTFQIVFYTLVVTAAFVQVYAEDKESLMGVFIAIIAMAGVFLWLEFLQFKDEWNRYQSYISPYNALDLMVFMLPMIASIHQLVNISRGDEHGNKSALSFSIVIILLHLLSELRVIQSVCKYVTIVLRILKEIQVFFIVFAAVILTFSLATLHLLHGCPVNGCISGQEGFPTNFFAAISSTYFIMGGRYDPVNQFLNEERWDIHIMMMIYFFFTVILMLNVLIALISVGFNKGDESWRLFWLENRLRYVESAESMSYYVPGFREKFDWFPQEIYYTASTAEIAAYRKKHDLDDWTTVVQLGDKSTGASGGDEVGGEQEQPAKAEDMQTMLQEMRENARLANERAQAADERAQASDAQLEQIKVEMQERARATDARVGRLQEDVAELLALIRAGKSV